MTHPLGGDEFLGVYLLSGKLDRGIGDLDDTSGCSPVYVVCIPLSPLHLAAATKRY